MYLWCIHYQRLWSYCCKGNSFRYTDAIKCDNACCRPYRTSAGPHNMHETSIHWWVADPQPLEHRPLAETKYDEFVTSSHYRKLDLLNCWITIMSDWMYLQMNLKKTHLPSINAANNFILYIVKQDSLVQFRHIYRSLFNNLLISPYCHVSLLRRHNGPDSISNHQPHDCLHNRLFRCKSKKTSKLRITGLCAGNSLGTGEFPAQMASNAEHVSIWWRHDICALLNCVIIGSVNVLSFYHDMQISWPNPGSPPIRLPDS